MVGVGCPQETTDNGVHGRDSGSPGIESPWQSLGAAPEIAGPRFFPRQEIDCPDILPPTQDLSDKALQAVKGHRVFPGEGQGGFRHLLRGQQADVQRGRKQRMTYRGLAGRDGTLIIPKISQPISQKIFQPLLGCLMGYRINKFSAKNYLT